MHPTASHAGPLDFMFSFTGTVPPGSVAGTVTGEIFGLTDNATGPASNVILDSYPAEELDAPLPPIDITQGTPNSFTVMNNAMTAAEFNGTDSTGVTNIEIVPPDNRLTITNPSTRIMTDVANIDGFAGVTFTLVQQTPEPSSVTLLGTGLGFAALWALRRRLRRRAASA
jgi:PEP-CTERM motif